MLTRYFVLVMAAWLPTVAIAQAPAPSHSSPPPTPVTSTPNTALDADRDPSTLVYIDPGLTKGASIKLEISTLKERSSKGSRPEKKQGTTHVLVEVLDVTADGTSKIAWTQTIPNAAAEAKAMGDDPMAAMLRALDGLRLEFGLTADGELTGLDNFTAVGKTMQNAVDAVLERKRRAGETEDALAAVRTMMTDLYADEVQATAVLMREANLYFQIYGYELEAGKPTEYETLLGNPLGGEPYPASGTWRLEGFSPKATPPAKSVKVRWQQAIDEKAGIRILVDTLRAMADKLGKPTPQEEVAKLMKIKFEISDDATYHYNRETGFIESMRYKRTTVTDDQRQNETVTIRKAD